MEPDNNVDYVGLVKQAQLGDRESLERLAGLVRERLRVDVYRLTLRPDLTQDIVQESMLEMFKVLGKLKEAERFWPWLYRIALNKMHHCYRTERQQKTMTVSAARDCLDKKDGDEAMANMAGQELKQIVFRAMQGLKPEFRAVLTMRCYREMEYSLIAESMGCSEFAAKMLFYRAKNALKKQLSRQGFGKGSLLMALVLFGKMTAPSEAAAAQLSVSAAAAKVGVAAGLLGVLSSKTAVISLAAAGALAVGTIVATSGPDGPAAAPEQTPVADSHVAARPGRAAEAADEHWYYFPQGADGPVLIWAINSEPQGEGPRCVWHQNERGNYRFDARKNTVYIENYRKWRSDLAVWRLPVDTPELTEFLSRVDGRGAQIDYVADTAQGLLVIARADGKENGSSSQIVRHEHLLDEEYFLYDRPAGAKTIDNRDQMHKRGWTYFAVEGRINAERVSGVGRLPFVYAQSQAHTPWLIIRVGSHHKIADSGVEALVYDESGNVAASYRAGTFFKGLTRPWMGLHAIDTVRRDAAEQRVWSETKYNGGELKAEVILTCGQGRLVYTIDMETDVIDAITISTSDGKEGQLRFSYLQNIDQPGGEFVQPRISGSYAGKRRASPGILWLLQLATRDP
ncbi:MAG TPA: RNA polymerase sigma factor [Sedimentisphaerales bacterium]|nr:RNA polymerase sigma factor [Sedimentisphaerales bacterium]